MAVRSLLHITLFMAFLWSTNAQDRVSTIVKPGCDETCGDDSVPVAYPFGIEKSDCYMKPEFAVTCNRTADGSYKPFLKSTGMEFLEVSLEGYVRVNNSVISSNCRNRTDSPAKVDLSGSSFTYSSLRNKFTVMGCDNYAKLLHNDSVIGGCLSVCDSTDTDGCFGIGCCQTMIPKSLNSFKTNMSRVASDREARHSSDCRSAFMVDDTWFNLETSSNFTQTIEEMKQREYVPAALEWGYNQGKCDIQSVSFRSNGYSWEEIDQNYLCVCREEDPFSRSIPYVQQYIRGGCRGESIPNCLKNADLTNCYLMCVHSPGSRSCLCPTGYNNDGKGRCYKEIDVTQSQLNIILIGSGTGIALLLLLIGVWWLYKIVKRRKAIKLKQKYFKRNGGRLLQQQWSSSETNLEQTKMFSLRELKKITDNFHVNRVVGHGGQGTVYKGMLTDGRIVAIKKSKVVDEDKVGQFINEVVILSQIYHRNVVKLLGCCLETEVPLLVYEFVPNGTLYDRIHNPNEEFPVTWAMRLSIATEIASALSYLHSEASVPIYHRDIKSSNILLDGKYKAKVSDFGISKSVSIDQTHVTTRVQGTLGYLDPEYFQSNQFTEKSDVFSFGVVLVELLTGKKPIATTRSTKERSLVRHFLDLMEEDRLFEILDRRVAKEASKKEIAAVSHIVKRCLNLKGKERPTMKTVAMELEEMKASKGGGSFGKDDHEEMICDVGEAASTFDTWEVTSSSIQSYPTSFLEAPMDADPLLSELSINN